MLSGGGDLGTVRGHHTARLGSPRGGVGPWARSVDGGSRVGLEVLWVQRLWGQRLLRHHHGRPPWVAHGPHVGRLTGHRQGLLGHVWHRQLPGQGLLLLLLLLLGLLLLHGERSRRHGSAGHLRPGARGHVHLLMGEGHHLLRSTGVPWDLLWLLGHHVMRGQPGGDVLVAGQDVRLGSSRRQLRRGQHVRVHVVRRHGAGHHLGMLLLG